MVKLYDGGAYLVNGTQTVSYTHLDVYKRQIQSTVYDWRTRSEK